jgi:hypothetical protein
MKLKRRIGRAVRLLGVAVLATGGAGDGRGAAPVRAAAQSGPLIPELVGYWRLDEPATATQAADSSGYNNHGTYGGPVRSTELPPMTNFSCNSASRSFVQSEQDAVRVPDSASLSMTGSLTLAAWIRPTLDSSTQQGIIEKWEWTGSAAIRGYMMRLNSSEHLSFAVCHNTGNNGISTAPRTIPLNTWTHVAATYDAGTQQMTMYVNGNPDPTTGTATAPADGSSQLVLGVGMDAHFFNGQIDEARVYNRSLSQAEINILRTGQAPPGGLLATEGLNQVTLDWAPAAGATRYAVYRMDASLPAFTLLATPAAPPYTDTTATGGVSYTYYVTAISVMESCPSNQVTATPLSAPPPSTQPRTGDHEEGFFDGGRCSCGSSIPAGVAPQALLAAAALAAAVAAGRRRRFSR